MHNVLSARKAGRGCDEEPGDLFAICVAETTPDPFADFVSLSIYRTYLYGRGHMQSIYRTLSLQRVSHEVYKEF